MGQDRTEADMMADMDMDNGKNIVNDPDEWDNFQDKLKDLKEKDVNDIDQEDIDFILKSVGGLKEHFLNEIHKEDGNKDEVELFKEDLEYYYNRFFKGFKEEEKLFEYLEDKSQDYFYSKKMYQLCLLRGKLYSDKRNEDKESSSNLDLSKDLLGHLRLTLFIDFFETFPRFFETIFLRHMLESDNYKKEIRGRPNITREWYNLLAIVVSPLIKHDTLQKDLFNLRNDIAHSTFLVDGKELYIYFIKKNYNEKGDVELKTKDMENEIETIKRFQNCVIVISTEFDIRLLEKFKNVKDNEKLLKRWKHFFDIYLKYWLQLSSDSETKNQSID